MADQVTLWRTGRKKLAADPVFGPLVAAVGPVRATVSDEPPFVYLARSIIYQQLAGAAAQTIHGRFVKALKGEVTPEKVLRVRETTLRKAGLSGAKARAVRDLATKIRSGEVEVHDLADLPDQEVIDRLTRVWGIGTWTVQMYLMFRLHRPDVWPEGDLGVRQGFAKIHGHDPAPTQKEMAPLGEPYRPWRSAAAWYCWRALEVEL
ncbi:MAG: hypothetical protein RJQ04_01265 [Longimicrobiales bacterium]